MEFEEVVAKKLKKNVKFALNLVDRPEPMYFYLKQDTGYKYIQNRLLELRESYLEALKIEYFKDTTNISNDYFYTYGTLISTDSHKLGLNNTFLFNNIDGSNSVPIKLNLTYLNKLNIFRGQVVAIHGKNNGNNEIIVKRIFCFPTLNTPDIKNDTKLKIRVYSMCNLSTLQSSSWEDINAVIFNGLDYKDEDEYSEIYTFIESLTKFKNIKGIFIVPSLKELMAVKVFPQVSAYPRNYLIKNSNSSGKHDRNGLSKKGKVHFLMNPSEFEINGMLFSLTAFDPLSEVESELFVINKKLQGSDDKPNDFLCNQDIETNACYHLIYQKTFLPNIISKEPVQLDNKILSMPTAPNFYIFNSKKKFFSKQIGPSNVINMGDESNACEITIIDDESEITFI